MYRISIFLVKWPGSDFSPIIAADSGSVVNNGRCPLCMHRAHLLSAQHTLYQTLTTFFQKTLYTHNFTRHSERCHKLLTMQFPSFLSPSCSSSRFHWGIWAVMHMWLPFATFPTSPCISSQLSTQLPFTLLYWQPISSLPWLRLPGSSSLLSCAESMGQVPSCVLCMLTLRAAKPHRERVTNYSTSIVSVCMF